MYVIYANNVCVCVCVNIQIYIYIYIYTYARTNIYDELLARRDEGLCRYMVRETYTHSVRMYVVSDIQTVSTYTHTFSAYVCDD